MQAAKEILADPAQSRSNVLTIGMDSGFNSKSAFYSAFGHHSLMTPIQYWQSKVSRLTRLDYKAENFPDNRLQADSSNLSGALQNETHIWTVGPGPDGFDPNFR
jgi:AraC-like DNA-binding protein